MIHDSMYVLTSYHFPLSRLCAMFPFSAVGTSAHCIIGLENNRPLAVRPFIDDDALVGTNLKIERSLLCLRNFRSEI